MGGVLNVLKGFNQMASSVKTSKENLKDLTDKSRRDEDDIKCIRKSKIWSVINLILLVPFTVGLYFLTRMIISDMIMLGLIGSFALIAAYATSITKARAYTHENAPSLGALIFVYVNFGLAILAIFGVIACHILAPALF